MFFSLSSLLAGCLRALFLVWLTSNKFLCPRDGSQLTRTKPSWSRDAIKQTNLCAYSFSQDFCFVAIVRNLPRNFTHVDGEMIHFRAKCVPNFLSLSHGCNQWRVSGAQEVRPPSWRINSITDLYMSLRSKKFTCSESVLRTDGLHAPMVVIIRLPVSIIPLLRSKC